MSSKAEGNELELTSPDIVAKLQELWDLEEKERNETWYRVFSAEKED